MTRPDHDGDCDSRRAFVERRARHGDPRVGKREQRHDAERDPRVERLDQALGGRERFAARRVDVAQAFGQLVRRQGRSASLAAECRQLLLHARDESIRPEPRAHGGEQADDDTGDGRMDSGCVDPGPRDHARGAT